MTNREFYFQICCTHGCDDERGECYGKPLDDITTDMCIRCKEKWLDSEVEAWMTLPKPYKEE